ncbi:hypothetical protein ACFMF9_004491, partial [Shigella flexneri]
IITLRNQCCKHSKITLISSTSAFTMSIRDKWHKKPACGRVLFAFAITYKIGKVSDLHEYMPFNLLLQHFALKMPSFF